MAPCGSTAETSGNPDWPYNTSTLIAPDGSIAATYRKIHLFDVAFDNGPTDTESARVTPGDRLVTADVDGVSLGLTICYDLRFPELYRALAQPAYGHTMVIDPWGTVIARAPDQVGITRADIETDRATAVRRQIPVLANRRPEAYGL